MELANDVAPNNISGVILRSGWLASRAAKIPPGPLNASVLVNALVAAKCAAAWAATTCAACCCAVSLDLFLEGVDSLLPLKMFESGVDDDGREVGVSEAKEVGSDTED